VLYQAASSESRTLQSFKLFWFNIRFILTQKILEKYKQMTNILVNTLPSVIK